MHPSVRAQAGYELARAYWSGGRLDEAESALDRTCRPQADIVYARALELYGWIEVRRERYPIAARHFLDALETLKRSPHRDAAMHASLLYALVAIALDTLDLKLFARVRRDIDATSWSPGLQTRWFALRRLRAVARAARRQRRRGLAAGRRDALPVRAGLAAGRRADHRGAGRARRGRDLHPRSPHAQGDRHRQRRRLGRARPRRPSVLLEAVRDGVEVERAVAAALLQRWETLPPRAGRRGASRTNAAWPGSSTSRGRRSRAPRAAAPRRWPQLRAALRVWQGIGNRYAEARTLLALLELAVRRRGAAPRRRADPGRAALLAAPPLRVAGRAGARARAAQPGRAAGDVRDLRRAARRPRSPSASGAARTRSATRPAASTR